MEQIVRVARLTPDGKAEIIHVRESACSGACHQCSGCGAAKETMFLVADNPIHARPGDLVRMVSDTKQVMIAVAVFYVLPLVLFFAGYALGAWLGVSGGLVGGLGFCLGIGASVVLDRYTAKHKETVYTLVGYVAGH